MNIQLLTSPDRVRFYATAADRFASLLREWRAEQDDLDFPVSLAASIEQVALVALKAPRLAYEALRAGRITSDPEAFGQALRQLLSLAANCCAQLAEVVPNPAPDSAVARVLALRPRLAARATWLEKVWPWSRPEEWERSRAAIATGDFVTSEEMLRELPQG
jgi:hypothetical protein